MGIFNRFVNVLRANANAALDQAEDPELMLTQMISDLETQKREAKQRMTEALALQKRFERQTEQEEAVTCVLPLFTLTDIADGLSVFIVFSCLPPVH